MVRKGFLMRRCQSRNLVRSEGGLREQREWQAVPGGVQGRIRAQRYLGGVSQVVIEEAQVKGGSGRKGTGHRKGL